MSGIYLLKYALRLSITKNNCYHIMIINSYFMSQCFARLICLDISTAFTSFRLFSNYRACKIITVRHTG